MTDSSQLRGNAIPFQYTPSHIKTPNSNLPTLRGDAPTFYYTKAIKWQQKHRRSPATIPSQPQCGFLSRLPGEIRNQIYEFALIEAVPIPAVRVVQMPPQDELNPKYRYRLSAPALAKTCRQIRQECLAIAYSDNTFIFQLLPGQRCISKSLVNGWARRLAAAGLDKCVKRVACAWVSLVSGNGKVVAVKYSVTVTLGEDDSAEEKLAKQQYETSLNRKQRKKLKHQKQGGYLSILLDGDSALTGTAKPKVVFEVDPPIEGLCSHVLDAYARAFEGRRDGKSVRGYGALIDVGLTVCNFLRFTESDVWPLKICRICDMP
jgi:hypothetical protein